MLWRAPALTDILSVMIGLLVLVDSVFKLQVAVDSRRMGAHSWWVTLVCTVVCLVLGILLVFIGLFNTVINFLLAPRSKVPQAKTKTEESK